MKKFLVMLLVCILVFSITVNLTSCWWRRGGDEIEDDGGASGGGGTGTPDDSTNSDNGAMKDGAISLPPRPVESNQPEE